MSLLPSSGHKRNINEFFPPQLYLAYLNHLLSPVKLDEGDLWELMPRYRVAGEFTGRTGHSWSDFHHLFLVSRTICLDWPSRANSSDSPKLLLFSIHTSRWRQGYTMDKSPVYRRAVHFTACTINNLVKLNTFYFGQWTHLSLKKIQYIRSTFVKLFIFSF